MMYTYHVAGTEQDSLVTAIQTLAAYMSAQAEISHGTVIETDSASLANMIDELVDGNRVRSLAQMRPVPEPDFSPAPAGRVTERTIVIPVEPADPDPAPKAKGRKPRKPAETVSVETPARGCAVCGDPVSGRRKVCEKEQCKKEMQRRYVRESAARKRAKTAEPMPIPEEPEDDPFEDLDAGKAKPQTTGEKSTWPTGTMWHSQSGTLIGTYLAPWELGEAIRDGKFEEGDLMVHKVRGEHIAVLEKDHLKFIPISTGRPEGI
jgi:hypothetical protein